MTLKVTGLKNLVVRLRATKQVINPTIKAVSFFTQDIFDGVEHVDFYVTFFSDAILISIIRWLTEGAQIPPEEYLSQLRHILFRLARHAVDELGPFEEGTQAEPPAPRGQI